ncbi:MAG: PD-(D/E)XK motif protein [Mycoplasmataceae bacterium]|jgi:hypothetical protein|nr:PD-(D/E)XK motif protein [Mycoplasmataceae bacterium]
MNKELIIYLIENDNENKFGVDCELFWENEKNPFPQTFEIIDVANYSGKKFIKINKGSKIFAEYIQNELQFFYNWNLSFFENLKNIYNYWEQNSKNLTIKELIGDLGEVIFIHRLEKKGIKWADFYQTNDEKYGSLFDFNFNNKNIYLEVKTTTRNKSELTIDFRQLPCFNVEKNIFFICAIIDKIHNGATILKLIEEIGFSKNKHLHSIYKKYANELELVNQFTYNEGDEIYLINEKIIPEILYKNKGNAKSGKITITINSENDFCNIDDFIDKLK